MHGSSLAQVLTRGPRRVPVAARPQSAAAAYGRRNVAGTPSAPQPQYGRETRVLRRFFFAGSDAERGDRYPVISHYDVLMEMDERIDSTLDHLRYRYVDFLTLADAHGVINRDTNTADIGELSRWLDAARPRTRLDAYPLFVLAKQILRSMLSGELKLANGANAELQAQLAAQRAREEAMQARLTTQQSTAASAQEALNSQIINLEVAMARPAQNPFCVSFCAARTLNAAGQSRVTLLLR